MAETITRVTRIIQLQKMFKANYLLANPFLCKLFNWQGINVSSGGVFEKALPGKLTCVNNNSLCETMIPELSRPHNTSDMIAKTF